MPVIRVPEQVYLAPWSAYTKPELSWTRQPGEEGELLTVDVLGPGDEQLALPAGGGDGAPSGSIVRMRPYQVDAVNAVFASWASGKKAPLIVAPTGCHAAGQLIMMFDGSLKRVEDVAVGDQLMGPDSTPRNVLRLCRGTGRMVRIVPTKGQPFVVNEDHILSFVITRGKSTRPCPSDLERTLDMPVLDYEAQGSYFKHRAKLYRAPVCFPSPPGERTLDPYFLGLYIADGTCALLRAEISKPDEEVRDECQRQADLHGLRLVNRQTGRNRCPTWHMVGEKGQANPIAAKLSTMGLMPIASDQRFVPDAYRLGSRTVRAEVLAGLLDGDGHMMRAGYDFISKSKRLSADVAFIARSLGLAAYVTRCRKTCQTGASGWYFRVSISGDCSQLPLRIPRKRAPERKQKKNHLRTGFRVVRLKRRAQYFGFVLDGDRRYLLDDFTVTHNSGKTILAAETMRRHLAQRPLDRALFIAHRRRLLTQTIDKVRIVAPTCTVGLVQAKWNEIGRDITVASIQTLAHPSGRRLREVLADVPPSLVVLDEAHHSASESWRRVLGALRDARPNLRVMGITATPGRADGTSLSDVFDEIAFQTNLYELIRDGYLVPPRGVSVQINVNFNSVATDDGGDATAREKDFVRAQLAKVMNTTGVNEAIVQAWQKYGHDRKMIVFCCGVEHAHALAQTFNDAGYSAAAIDGSMKDDERDPIYEKFRTGGIKLLCSVEVLTEGFDEPSVEGVIFARPTQSQALYTQCIGRALRPYPSKTEALIIDCVGNSDHHQLVQLAMLAGLQPIQPYKGAPPEDDGEEPLSKKQLDTTLHSLAAREFAFEGLARRRETRYAWRETQYGWTLQIPKVGYFLVAWHDTDKTHATVRFHDLRPGKRDAPPLTIVREPIDFEMAYSLVEAEVQRLFSARSSRSRVNERELPEAATDIAEIIDIDDGFGEEIGRMEHTLLNDADWRNRRITERQIADLTRLGVKSMPDTAGEASDMISVMRVERDQKAREPATQKQLVYIRRNKLALPDGVTFETLTKTQAARIIFPHRQMIEAKKNGGKPRDDGAQLGLDVKED